MSTTAEHRADRALVWTVSVIVVLLLVAGVVYAVVAAQTRSDDERRDERIERVFDQQTGALR